MYCRNCGKEIEDKAVICVHCGCEVKPITTKKRENTNNATGCAVIALIFIILFIIGNVKVYQINEQINKQTGQNSSLLHKMIYGK